MKNSDTTKHNDRFRHAEPLCSVLPGEEEERERRRQIWAAASETIEFHKHPEAMTFAQLTDIDEL